MLSNILKAATSTRPNLQFVGGQARSNLSTGTQTPSFSLLNLLGGLDTAPQIGDFVIVGIVAMGSADYNIQCTSAGYTEVSDLYSNSTTAISMAVYRKRLTTAETSVAFDLGVSTRAAFAVHVWRKLDNTTPANILTTSATGVGGVPNAPSVGTSGNGVVVVFGAASGGNIPTNLSTLTVPSGMENFYQLTSAAQACIGVASARRSVSGTYDPAAFGGGNASTALAFCATSISFL